MRVDCVLICTPAGISFSPLHQLSLFLHVLSFQMHVQLAVQLINPSGLLSECISVEVSVKA